MSNHTALILPVADATELLANAAAHANAMEGTSFHAVAEKDLRFLVELLAPSFQQ